MSAVKRYLASIGRRGGLKSRRVLDPAAARAMVAVREARRAYRRFHALCFSSHRADLKIAHADVTWIAEQLKHHGDREASRAGIKLIALNNGATPNRQDRSRMTARVVSLWSAEAGDARMGGTAEERVAAVAELTAEAWRLSGRPFPSYARATMPVVASTLRDHAQEPQ